MYAPRREAAGALSVVHPQSESHLPHSFPSRVFGLDVLRALAISGVLLAHGVMVFWPGTLGWTAMGGTLGVELFFVLSGFLIGGLLLDIAQRGPTVRHWQVFLVRRWMRTLPLYFVCLVALLFMPDGPGAKAFAAYVVLGQNLAWPMVSGWFPVSWSLMVEEWFYLLFGSVMLVLAAVRPRIAVPVSCAVFMVVPWVARWLVDSPGTLAWDDGLRKVVVLRLDAIAYGVLLAWLWQRREAALRRFAIPALAVGVLLLAWVASVGVGDHDSSLWRASAFCVLSLGCALCFPAAIGLRDPGGIWGRAIGWLSTRSYGMYLIHLTAFEWGSRAIAGGVVAPRLGLLLTALTLCVVVEFCYRAIELPCLRRRPPQFAAKRESATAWASLAARGKTVY